jgi:hypothetical protein
VPTWSWSNNRSAGLVQCQLPLSQPLSLHPVPGLIQLCPQRCDPLLGGGLGLGGFCGPGGSDLSYQHLDIYQHAVLRRCTLGGVKRPVTGRSLPSLYRLNPDLRAPEAASIWLSSSPASTATFTVSSAGTRSCAPAISIEVLPLLSSSTLDP